MPRPRTGSNWNESGKKSPERWRTSLTDSRLPWDVRALMETGAAAAPIGAKLVASALRTVTMGRERSQEFFDRAQVQGLPQRQHGGQRRLMLGPLFERRHIAGRKPSLLGEGFLSKALSVSKSSDASADFRDKSRRECRRLGQCGSSFPCSTPRYARMTKNKHVVQPRYIAESVSAPR
jgi:hypothetical protein